MLNLFRRKKLLIYPRFQLLLICVNSLLMFGMFMVNLGASHRVFVQLNQMGRSIDLAPNHPYFKFIGFQEDQIYANLIISFIISLVLAVMATMVLSHRLAGPIVRLKGFFQSISNNKSVTENLRFRKGDFFEDLPGVVNDALKEISQNGVKRP